MVYIGLLQGNNKLSNLIINWGFYSGNVGNNVKIKRTFACSYQSFVIPLAIPIRNAELSSGQMVVYKSPNLTDVTYMNDGDNAELGFYWIAIGN